MAQNKNIGASSALDKWLNRPQKKETHRVPGKMPAGERAPLSHGQERLWLLEQLYPGQNLYTYAHHYHIEGHVDIDALVKSFGELWKRHEILRTNYRAVDQTLIQVARQETLPVEHIYLENDPDQKKTLEAQIKQLTQRPFDLASGPLFRLHVFHLGKDVFECVLLIHHMNGDGWSMGIINREVSDIYRSMINGQQPDLEPLAIQYKDFAWWNRNRKVRDKDLAYWKEKLAGELPVLDLPLGNNAGNASFSGRSLVRYLPGDLTAQLQSLAKSSNTTMFVLLLTAFKVLLHKYSRQTDILVASPFSNRDFPELEGMIGFFNETLVLRTALDGDPGFLQLMDQVSQHTVEAMAHKDVPFNTLVNAMNPDRGGKNPLFQTMFLYNTLTKGLDLGESVRVEEGMLDIGVSKFDLTLFVNEEPDRLRLTFEHTAAFDEKMMEAMAGHFENMLTSIVARPGDPVSSLSMLSAIEIETITRQWNDTHSDQPFTELIHELIHGQTLKTPDAIAVIYQDQTLTYRELDHWASAVAAELIGLGILRNDFVGLYTYRSLEMIVGIMAILKAGGAYLPLDPDYPEERIRFMLSDAGATVVLSQPDHSLPSDVGQVVKIRPSADYPGQKPDIPVVNEPDDLAYIIYTSGSTGRPKGVMVSHKNLVHSTTARFAFYEDEMRCFLLLSSFSFDSSVTGIFWSLCSGGSLVLPPARIEQDIDRLSAIIREHQVTHTLLLPTLYQVILDYSPVGDLRSLVAVMVAGEACSTQIPKSHFEKLPRTRLYNEYGPTEATVWCVAHEISPSDTHSVIPIGSPIPNARAYILDEHLQPLPVGIPGELYIGGAGVTRGYCNRADLTKQRFIADPFDDPGQKLYKTGDLAKYRSDGVIEYLGRADHQIKIRGYRIELEEIKAAILRNENITDAVVRAGGEPATGIRIMAWVQSPVEAIEATLLKELKEYIPDYMIPSAIVVLPALPKLPNGKIDTKRLPEPSSGHAAVETYVSPSNEVQETLVKIWQEVLNIEKIGVRDNFFDIGGDSILSIRIVSRARQEGWSIGPNQVFEHQTIEQLSPHIRPADREQKPIQPVTASEQYPMELPLSYQQQAFLFHSLQSGSDQGFLQLVFDIRGDITIDIMQQAWDMIFRAHPVMRTSFDWENREAPCQVIRAEVSLQLAFEDLCDQSDREETVRKYMAADARQGLDLQVAPCSRIRFFKLESYQYRLCWTCHHILLDGWSAAIILQDALACYRDLTSNTQPAITPVPNYKSYLKWKNEQDIGVAKAFWKDLLDGQKSPKFSNYFPSVDSQNRTYADLTIHLSANATKDLEQSSRSQRLTLNTVCQGLWMITLSQFFGQNDITIGSTVSGRSSDFPGMERITGLFMNVLPLRKIVDPKARLSDWLQSLQSLQAQLKPFESIETEKIRGWIGVQEELFDSLFVFGNFMKSSLRIGDLVVDAFKGGFSSTFPLTLRVNPTRALEINLRYDSTMLDEAAASWLINRYESNLVQFASVGASANILELAPEKPYIDPEEKPLSTRQHQEITHTYQSSRNPVQLALTKIWENILGRELIGIHDNYFDLGGSSLAALKLFHDIEQQFGKKIPPTALITHPTIDQLSTLLSAEGSSDHWSSVVPMKTSGDQRPLFCLHSGGAHVLFYQGLARHMSKERPVYALQPNGMDGNETYHESITAMASHYIEEMKKVQAKGPFYLVGTCFGNAVGLEMIHQLSAMGEEVGALYIIDSGPAFTEPPLPNGERMPVRRMLAMVRKGNWRGIVKKFRNRFIRFNKKLQTRLPTEVELDEMIESLNGLYTSYTWKPIDGKVVLIRSSEFSRRKDKRFHLEQWTSLSKGNLETFEVDGHHVTLFEEPEVRGLARTLSDHLAITDSQSL